MNTPELNHSAAQAVIRLLSRHAEDETPLLLPYVERLFAALQDGHSFIWLNDDDVKILSQASICVSVDGNTPFVMQGKRLFIGRMWQLEYNLATEILRIAAAKPEAGDWLQTSQNLTDWFNQTGSEGQQRAAALALLQSFMLITGGPGTGKTTTVAKLLALICGNHKVLPRIALAAPTGKAAAHMARALHNALDGFDMPAHIKTHLLQLEGQTVHRLLKLRPPRMLSSFHAEHPLPLDVLIIDEASMLDTSLLLQLLQAVPSACRVILLGDAFQLPSVGAGAVLASLSQTTVLDKETDLELSQILPRHGFQTASNTPALSCNTATLTHSHRFGADSGIGCLARAVVSGDAQQALAQFSRFPEALSLQQASVRAQAELLFHQHQRYWQAVDNGDVALVFGCIADIIVLAAWKNDADRLNVEYQKHLIRQGKLKADATWYAGQIIMISRNDYTLEVFNGDIGVILPDPEAIEGLSAYFPDADGFKTIPISRLPAFEPAFAMTVHKSQGSEYREVWLIPPSHVQAEEGGTGLNRALLYTALTRARETFTYWGDSTSFTAAVTTDRPRRSALTWMLNKIIRKE